MNIQQEVRNGILIIIPGGRINQDSQDEFERAVQKAVADGHRQIVLEMSDVLYINCLFMRVVAGAAKDTQNGLVLCSVPRRVKRTFEAVGFDKFFAIYPDLAAALAHFQS